ncbi:MAG: hypothetical protein RL648_1126, partial [Verrucomicrobiota bacterium]
MQEGSDADSGRRDPFQTVRGKAPDTHQDIRFKNPDDRAQVSIAGCFKRCAGRAAQFVRS